MNKATAIINVSDGTYPIPVSGVVRQIPSIGRVVHYRSYGSPKGEFSSEARAAIITNVHKDNLVDLAIFNPTGIFFNCNCSYGDQPGEWSWPPRN